MITRLPSTRDTPLVRLAVLVLTALVARAITAGSPLVHVDETFYLTVARAMTHGALPYVDLWDRKPVGLFLVYLPAAIWPLPAALYVYQAMAAASVVATAWLVGRLADRAGWRAGALPAGIAYILWLNLADGQGGQSPVFYDLLMAAAAGLALDTAQGSRRRRGVAAMLLVGLALQIKYSVLFEGVALGLWLLAVDWRRGRSAAILGYAATLVAAALLPTGVAIAVYAWLGHLGDFVYANFVSIGERGSDAPALLLDHARDCFLTLTPAVLTLVGGWRGEGDDDQRRAASFVRAWLVVALLAVVGFGGWANHYALPVMLPASVALAAPLRRRARPIWWAAAPLLALFVAGQAILVAERGRRGTAAEFAALAALVGPGNRVGGEGLFIYSGPVLLFPATGRPPLSRYLFPSHLEFTRERGAIGIDQADEIKRIFARSPEVVVIGPPIGEERPDIRALVMALLRAGGYRAGPPVMLGRGAFAVYHRPATSRPSPPAAR